MLSSLACPHDQFVQVAQRIDCSNIPPAFVITFTGDHEWTGLSHQLRFTYAESRAERGSSTRQIGITSA